jgi:hypothetical protein
MDGVTDTDPDSLEKAGEVLVRSEIISRYNLK